MGGKFRKILNILLDKEENPQTDAVQDAVVVEEVGYQQENGTMVSVDANEVSVSVSGNNKEVRVAPRPQIKIDRQQMGGEEIKPGTLH